MKPDTRMDEEYALLDSGDGKKLERFGRVVLSRPCAQAVWAPTRPAAEWARADAAFDRTEGNQWHNRGALPGHWTIRVGGIAFQLSGTDFGHLGIFPEQRAQWCWIRDTVRQACAARRLRFRCSICSPIRAAPPWRRRWVARRCAIWTLRRAWCNGRATTPG